MGPRGRLNFSNIACINTEPSFQTFNKGIPRDFFACEGKKTALARLHYPTLGQVGTTLNKSVKSKVKVLRPQFLVFTQVSSFRELLFLSHYLWQSLQQELCKLSVDLSICLTHPESDQLLKGDFGENGTILLRQRTGVSKWALLVDHIWCLPVVWLSIIDVWKHGTNTLLVLYMEWYLYDWHCFAWMQKGGCLHILVLFPHRQV